MSTIESRVRSAGSEYPGIYRVNNGQVEQAETEIGYPWRVRNRMILHKMGACGMPTTIVEPEQKLDLSTLRQIAVVSSAVNSRIGLDERVESLFIRTRDKETKARLFGTNPVLIIDKVNSWWPSMRTIDNRGKLRRVWFLSRWRRNMSSVPMYLMIHEENAKAQKRSIHGRLMRKAYDQAWEISLGTGVMHARQIGREGSKYVSMGGHDLEWMVENVSVGNMWSILTHSSIDDAVKLASGVVGYIDELRLVIARLEKIGYVNVVAEFRAYGPNESGDDGLHVYDFDSRF